MHAIFIETSKLKDLNTFIDTIASIWHFNLWPLKRYLYAVESDQISMDNLLDLIYSLEGLFGKSTSADFIKILCMLLTSNNRKDAKSIKNLLDVAYRIRNNIAHGERSYDPYEYENLEGKKVLVQTVYWRTKQLVAAVLQAAIYKTVSNKEMKNLRFNENDLIDLIYEK